VGSLGTLPDADASALSFPVQLNEVPAAGDEVFVEGFDSGNNKYAEGSYTLPVGYTVGTPVSITLALFRAGTGNVSLGVSFPAFPAGQEITAAELSLYRSFADYQAGTVYEFTRYRKYTPGGDYGAGEDLPSDNSIPISCIDLPSGNYVVKIEFFRFKYVRVSRLVQTIIVRDGFTTASWDGGDSNLDWGEDKFASSNANLSGIEIGGEAVTLQPDKYSYNVYKETSDAPSDKALTITAGTPGQNIDVSLNGDPVTDNNLTNMEAANSIVITVTAPDGFTKQTYAVSYTYQYETKWDAQSGDGVEEALDAIRDTYNGDWPGYSEGSPVAARINISGTITESVNINGSGLPPILLAGTGTITADGAPNRPLTITSATVILGDGLTLTGGNNADGAGVQVDGGSFTMNGGTISDNTGGSGGGVHVWDGSFTMTGGNISGNTSGKDTQPAPGGGVYVYVNGDFIMSGGTITGNTATGNGGGVCFAGSGNFTMGGGTITGNTATGNGGGVYVASSGSFNMQGGALINTDNDVWLENGKKITIMGDLTGTPPVARITPQTYSTTTQVLDGTIADNYDKFTVTPSGGDVWTIDSAGTLNQQ
jgi:parallel beta-helix repeat protein